tara:strand:- start:1331 stop:2038 length:708 start_codon:yes stop_codon:yes gene_type:complete
MSISLSELSAAEVELSRARAAYEAAATSYNGTVAKLSKTVKEGTTGDVVLDFMIKCGLVQKTRNQDFPETPISAYESIKALDRRLREHDGLILIVAHGSRTETSVYGPDTESCESFTTGTIDLYFGENTKTGLEFGEGGAIIKLKPGSFSYRLDGWDANKDINPDEKLLVLNNDQISDRRILFEDDKIYERMTSEFFHPQAEEFVVITDIVPPEPTARALLTALQDRYRTQDSES